MKADLKWLYSTISLSHLCPYNGCAQLSVYLIYALTLAMLNYQFISCMPLQWLCSTISLSHLCPYNGCAQLSVYLIYALCSTSCVSPLLLLHSLIVLLLRYATSSAEYLLPLSVISDCLIHYFVPLHLPLPVISDCPFHYFVALHLPLPVISDCPIHYLIACNSTFDVQRKPL